MELLAAAIIMMRRRSTRLVAGQYARTQAATSTRWCEVICHTQLWGNRGRREGNM